MSSNQARELPEPESVTAELIAIYPEYSSEPRKPGMPSSFPLGLSQVSIGFPKAIIFS
jgi:hypothetical protein